MRITPGGKYGYSVVVAVAFAFLLAVVPFCAAFFFATKISIVHWTVHCYCFIHSLLHSLLHYLLVYHFNR
jgi:hypothetical protein